MRHHSIFIMFYFSLSIIPTTLNASALLEMSLGNTLNLNSRVTVTQDSYDDLHFKTAFESRGLQAPMYYSIRGGWEGVSCNYEIEMIHNKLYATQLPEEIQHFEISHGLNSIFANRTCPMFNSVSDNSLLNDLQLRIGLGGALANPYTIVRNQEWFENGGITAPILNESGYHLTGPFVQIGIQHFLLKNIILETKWVTGRVDIPVMNGNAIFWHQSFHILIGLSFN